MTTRQTSELVPCARQKPSQKPLSRNTQLPSPVSPTTQLSPPSPAASAPTPSSQTLVQSDHDMTSAFGSRNNLVPIKGFVHEVLRRSRTSGSVLQTALCYLEAIRPKVPELVREENTGQGVKGEPESASRIVPATDAELEREGTFMSLDSIINTDHCSEDVMDTVRVSDGASDNTLIASEGDLRQDSTVLQGNKKQKSSGLPLPPLPPLPSPLLCPRRAFLAALILASKFTQDKCYSNRAWAKLSGLPPREIGRCERALGEALEWRLWVGKLPPAQAPAVQAISPVNRPVVRAQSESCLMDLTSTRAPFLPRNEKNSLAMTSNLLASSSGSSNNPQRGLRRSTTLPANAYTTISSGPIKRDQAIGGTPAHDLSLSNVAQQDQCMSSPNTASRYLPWLPSLQVRPLFHISAISLNCLLQYDDPSTAQPYSSSSFYFEKTSTSPQTPSLTYSPTSTESSSSSGDRTIQMTTFPDDSMAPSSSDYVNASTESWPWLDVSDGTIPFGKISPPFSHGIPTSKPPLDLSGTAPLGDLYFQSFRALPSKVPPLPGASAHSYPWRSEEQLLMMGPFGLGQY